MKIKLFRFLAIILLANTFLLIVSRNLPFPISSYTFWSLAWAAALILFRPKVLFTSSLKLIYFYALFYGLMFLTFWSGRVDVNFVRINSEILEMFTAISIYIYFIESKDFEGLALVIKYSIIFIVISCITSINGLLIYPFAARELAGTLAEEGFTQTIIMYGKLGIGQYAFFAGITFLIPVIIYQIKYGMISRIQKNLLILITATIFISLVMSQYFANLIISIIVAVFALLGKNKLKTSLVISFFLIIIIFIVPIQIYIKLFNSMIGIFDLKELNDKLTDLVLVISGAGYGNTGFDYRAERFPVLFDSFLSNPLIGGGVDNAHLHWMNKLSVFGILGIIPFVLILYNQLKLNSKILSQEYFYYYLLAFISFIALGTVKSLIGRDVDYLIFLIVPGIYFLKNFRK